MESTVFKSMSPELMKQRQTNPHSRTHLLETKTVKLKDSDHEEPVIINASDFNPDLHEEVSEEEAQEAQAESMGKGEEGDEAADYKVFKAFKFGGKAFEQNAQVTLRKSIAHKISKRFKCIWPVSDLNTVEQNSALRDKLVRGLGGENELRDPNSGPATGDQAPA